MAEKPLVRLRAIVRKLAAMHDDVTSILRVLELRLYEPDEKAESVDDGYAIPEELNSLDLYKDDLRLCKAWPELLPAWLKGFNDERDWVLAEVGKAHRWEVGNPSRRKKDRARFLTSWLDRAWDRRRAPGSPPSRPSTLALTEREIDEQVRRWEEEETSGELGSPGDPPPVG